MPRLNKKLWSFNVGCFASGSFIWLAELSTELPVPHFVLSNSLISISLYTSVVMFITAALFTLCLITFMHKGLKVHSSEHTFWLVLPILSFLIMTSIVANVLVITMMSAAIPALFVILVAARKPKERRIFDMKKALS